ncbi:MULTISPECIES: rod shape-determining protein RodA [Marinimicrobium]|jgi:rod shape determining protein RodA|uniref:Peptidoglycan glycosyltransferase MrdB n=3 Tax=Marinimicrobium TaxID=359337 RepID=A0A3N1P8H3_9GAMM|nr:MULTISPECIES: rod shape-determining protein RodA [Marinimicrobium]MAN52412.1 rod shape-determining protein RodA [Marinimicrobium sp.]ROQ21026.1 cell elongation-specific peptidoglycan biosynthesis regulator RodA [Marinimicrobium koreense]
MSHQDFLRRLPEAGQGLRRRDRLQQRLHLDFTLLLLLLAVAAYGLVVLYSANGQSMSGIQRQGAYFLVAFVAMFVTAQVPPHLLRRLAPWMYGGGVLLLVLVLVLGIGAMGAQRWLGIGGFRFQPSEVMKLATPIMVSAYLGQRLLPPRLKHVLLTLILVAVPALLIVQQPDLGTSLLVASSGLVVLFFAGLSWRYIVTAFVAVLASIWPLWKFGMHEYQRQRVLTLFNPEQDSLGAGWNIIQSKTAIGSGGYSGKGWLQGTQSQLDFLPEGHTDFIIAVLGEEFGLMGVLLLLGLYVLIIARGLLIALRAQDSFSRLLAASITFTFFVYMFVNVGMVSGLLPVVGVPLPLVSQGGTAIVTLMAGFGILMSIATERRRVTRQE